MLCAASPANWPGNDITLNHNGVQIGTFEQDFTDKTICIPVDQIVDMKTDTWQLVNGGGNGVSIYIE